MKKVLLFFIILCSSFNAFAHQSWDECLKLVDCPPELDQYRTPEQKETCRNAAVLWHNVFFDESTGLFKGQKKIDASFIGQHKQDFYLGLGSFVVQFCGTEDIPNLFKHSVHNMSEGKNYFDTKYKLHLVYPLGPKDEEYTDIEFTGQQVLMNLPQVITAVLVTNKNFQRGQRITKADMPQEASQTGVREPCSDQNITGLTGGGVGDDMAINRAAQVAYGADEEYYIDFAVHDNMRAFPGLLIKHYGNALDAGVMGTADVIVTQPTATVALNAIDNFVKQFNNTRIEANPNARACSGLKAYLVAFDRDQAAFYNNEGNGTILRQKSANKHMAEGLGVAVVTAAITDAAVAKAAGRISAKLASRLSSAWIPGVGWAVAAGLTVYSIYEATHFEPITNDLNELFIVAGPYSL